MSKHVTNEDLLEELSVLKAQIHSLQEQIGIQQSAAIQEGKIRFLLAEFNHIGEFWRHADSRMESSLNLYFTASAVIASGLVYISQQSVGVYSFLAIMALAAAALFVGGMMVARRILYTSFLKAHYIGALNLIRRYFVDLDDSLSTYLALPIAVDAGKDSALLVPYSRARIPIPLLAVIYPWCSLLLGFVAGTIIWFLQLQLLVVVSCGVMVAVSCFIVLVYVARQQVKAQNKQPSVR